MALSKKPRPRRKLSKKAAAEIADRKRRMAWWHDARFGMFVHWGLYSLLGRHEWVQNNEGIPREEYALLADKFKPKPGCIRAWAKLARKAGMKYMVLTTKHHEGYCLWDSGATEFNSVKTGPKRDLIAEYVDACRAEGLKVGFYYSLMDWRHPDGLRCRTSEPARTRFVAFTHTLVRELMTDYGKVDILWYDGDYPLEADKWESKKLNRMVRRLQPDIIINNRSRVPEDYKTPEEEIVPADEGRAWEACMTFNGSWGFSEMADEEWLSAREVVKMLRKCVAGGGNLLLNIGPTPEGDVPPEAAQMFQEVGQWLAKYGPSIYDATDPMPQDRLITGTFTRRGQTLYFHCHRWPGEELALGGLRNEVLAARFFGGEEIQFTQQADRLVLHGLPAEAPDPLATVIELEVSGEPKHKLAAGCVLLEEI